MTHCLRPQEVGLGNLNVVELPSGGGCPCPIPGGEAYPALLRRWSPFIIPLIGVCGAGNKALGALPPRPHVPH